METLGKVRNEIEQSSAGIQGQKLHLPDPRSRSAIVADPTDLFEGPNSILHTTRRSDNVRLGRFNQLEKFAAFLVRDIVFGEFILPIDFAHARLIHCARRLLPVRIHVYWSALLCVASVYFPAVAEVFTDGSLGFKGRIDGPDYVVGPEHGQMAGANLFHSFGQLNIASGESLSFGGPPDVQNIIARVTGGSPSTIDGTVRSLIPSANLFLLNRSGILLGPNASIDISGSLALSTGSHLRFADGSEFRAELSASTTLTIAPPAAFGFLGDEFGAIEISGSDIRMPVGARVELSAPQIHIRGSRLHAPGGHITLAGPPDSGETMPFTDGTVITVAGGSRIDVGNGDNPAIRAKAIGPAAPTPSSGNGTILIRAGQLIVDGSALYQTAHSRQTRPGRIQIHAGEFLVRNGAQIVSSTLNDAAGGDVQIETRTTRLSEGSIVKTTTAHRAGPSGDLDVVSRRLEVLGGSELGADSFGTGDTGDLNIRAEELLLDSRGVAAETPVGTSSFELGSGGRAGAVRVTAERIELLNSPGGGLVGLGSRTFGNEPSGEVHVEAKVIRIDGGNARGAVAGQPVAENTAIGSVNFTRDAGPSGDVRIRTGELTITGYGIISAATFGHGNAGNIDVEAGAISLNHSSIVSSAAPGSTGDGGHIRVAAGDLQIRNRGGIAARTSGRGNAGNLHVTAQTILLDFGAISADAMPKSQGNGGAINLQARQLHIRNGGAIIASAAGTGTAGSITVTTGQMLIDSRDQQEPFSSLSIQPTFTGTGISSQTLRSATGGRGGTVEIVADLIEIAGDQAAVSSDSYGEPESGDIMLRAGRLRLREGAQISSSSSSGGASGRIQIELRDSLHLDNSFISAAAQKASAKPILIRAGSAIHLRLSHVTAQAAQNGGELHLQAGKVVVLHSSNIISKAGGQGGNISIEEPFYLVLNKAQLDARAMRANGGNIHLASGLHLSSADTLLRVTSQLGLAGQITILGPSVNFAPSIVALPSALLQSETRLPEHCGIKLGPDISSFVVLQEPTREWRPDQFFPDLNE